MKNTIELPLKENQCFKYNGFYFQALIPVQPSQACKECAFYNEQCSPLLCNHKSLIFKPISFIDYLFINRDENCNIGEIIKRKREQYNLTLQEVSDALGVNKSVVSKYENGIIKNLGTDKVIKICKLFRMTPNQLFGFEE